MNLPRNNEIRRSFKRTVREVKLAIKEVNQRAAKFMQRGDYAAAQELMAQGQRIHAFLAELQGFQKRLCELRGGSGGVKPAKGDKHSLWEYYQPILKTLAALGGESTRPEIEKRFEQEAAGWLKPGDRSADRRGRQRWVVMIARARKPLKEEGLIETPNLLRWRITDAGRKAATVTPAAARHE